MIWYFFAQEVQNVVEKVNRGKGIQRRGEGYRQLQRCSPGGMCFVCPYPDCRYQGPPRKEEVAILSRGIGDRRGGYER